jgi:hypothetical protein
MSDSGGIGFACIMVVMLVDMKVKSAQKELVRLLSCVGR